MAGLVGFVLSDVETLAEIVGRAAREGLVDGHETGVVALGGVGEGSGAAG